MTCGDATGYLAAGLVFVAFGMKEMVPLRIIAICSNLAFIAYGIGLDLPPIWLLHAGLLPLNGWRLWQVVESSDRSQTLVYANSNVGVDGGSIASGAEHNAGRRRTLARPPARKIDELGMNRFTEKPRRRCHSLRHPDGGPHEHNNECRAACFGNRRCIS